MQINVLGWIKKQFIHYPNERREGYVFTVDNKPLEFRSFEPICWYDVDIDALLKNSCDDVYEYPSVACCTCGCVDCDSVRAFVEFKNDYVIWTLFILHECKEEESIKESQIEKYTFAKEQYLQIINSLKDSVEKDKLERHQKKENEYGK